MSVVIANYNYAQFLGDAIDSALAQSHRDVEIVVVDDGSTDDSGDVIAAYGSDVKALFIDNQGQAAAVNAGVAASRGAVVSLLDADDMFHRDKLARIAAVANAPELSVIYHSLQPVDVDGNLIGRPYPRSVLRGDISVDVRRAGGWWPHPLTTALSFPRPFLDRVLPIPVVNPRLFADSYLAGLAPFHGEVIGLADALATNRLHSMNTWTRSLAKADHGVLRTRLARLEYEFDVLVQSLQRTGVPGGLSIADNPQVRQYRWAAGAGGSLFSALGATLRCPTLPWPMRWRLALRLLARRW